MLKLIVEKHIMLESLCVPASNPHNQELMLVQFWGSVRDGGQH